MPSSFWQTLPVCLHTISLHSGRSAPSESSRFPSSPFAHWSSPLFVTQPSHQPLDDEHQVLLLKKNEVQHLNPKMALTSELTALRPSTSRVAMMPANSQSTENPCWYQFLPEHSHHNAPCRMVLPNDRSSGLDTLWRHESVILIHASSLPLPLFAIVVFVILI